MRERLSPRVSGRVAGPHKLDPLQGDPGLVRRPVETTVLHDLPQEGDDTLSACGEGERGGEERRRGGEERGRGEGERRGGEERGRGEGKEGGEERDGEGGRTGKGGKGEEGEEGRRGDEGRGGREGDRERRNKEYGDIKNRD